VKEQPRDIFEVLDDDISPWIDQDGPRAVPSEMISLFRAFKRAIRISEIDPCICHMDSVDRGPVGMFELSPVGYCRGKARRSSYV
jgi:hypothetical protein